MANETPKTTLSDHAFDLKDPPPQNVFQISIIAPSIAFFGCQFAWAVQDGNVSPYLSELGMNANSLNYAWLLGPICGLIFQPIIGVFSDHCTSSLGRRRPFILYGACILTVCLLIFCRSDSDIFRHFFHISPLSIAFVTFWQLDFSTNLLEGPLRAITSDTLTQKQQLLSHSWFGIMNGCASIIGFALGYLIANVQIIFTIAAIVVVVTVTFTSVMVRETPLQKQTHKNKHKIVINRLKSLWNGLTHMPNIIKQCWLIQWCFYFGHFANWVYLCEYFGTQIMNGHTNVNSEAYKRGIEYGNLAFMFISMVSVLFSFAIPKCVSMFGLKKVWIFSGFVYGFVMICTLFVSNLYMSLFLFAFVGIPMSASFTIPWSIVGMYSNKYDRENACLWSVVLNVAECGPELIIALLSGFVIDLCQGRVLSVLVMAGLVQFCGVYLIAKTDLKGYNDLNGNNGKYDMIEICDESEIENVKEEIKDLLSCESSDEKMTDKMDEIIKTHRRHLN